MRLVGLDRLVESCAEAAGSAIVPRANRFFDRHGLWHLTHRCHKKDFLLRFARDRDQWRHWLYQARRRYGLCVLDFTITRNHIHLMVASDDRDTVPRSMRLIAGQTGRLYNQRKDRNGAFWEDRYHAVPIETARHLRECLVYIDLNMVRAGVVEHPRDWRWGGYREIQQVRQRYVVIDHKRLMAVTGFTRLHEFQAAHRDWLAEKLGSGPLVREERWTTDPSEESP